jgi:hypothetical protein
MFKKITLHYFTNDSFAVNSYTKQGMTSLVIDKKKYVLLPQKEYEALQKTAALKSKAEKIFSVEEARAYSKAKIRKWAAGK